MSFGDGEGPDWLEGAHKPLLERVDSERLGEVHPGCKLFVFIVFTQITQALMSYDGGATQFCTDALARDGWSAFELGILGAMDKFGQVATAYWCSELLTQYDVKALLAVGLFWKAACCFLFGLLQMQAMVPLTKAGMLAAKLGMGVTEALVSVWATVWVQCNAPPNAQARWLGLAGTSAGLGNGTGSGVASLWSPIYAFFLQAALLLVTWVALLLTPRALLKFSGDSFQAGDQQIEDVNHPYRYMMELVGHRASQPLVVAIESMRLPRYYLDASETPVDHGFRARITKGNPHHGNWAQFKKKRIEGHADCFCFESIRLPGYFLDASDKRAGMLDRSRKVRICEGDSSLICRGGSPSEAWAQFKIHRHDDETVSIESMRLPGHFLDASAEHYAHGTKVRITKADPSGDWARFRLHEFAMWQPEAEATSAASWSIVGARLSALLGNYLWLWTALAISLNCFVMSGVSFLWQNTVRHVWDVDNAWSFGCFLLASVGGFFGVAVGPKIFDGCLGGFTRPEGQHTCLLWCKRMAFGAAVCGTVCVIGLLQKVCYLVMTNERSVEAWQIAAFIGSVMAIFFVVNSVTGTFYGINIAAVKPEQKPYAAALTVSFQNIFGYACGPLLPGAAASFVSIAIPRIWPGYHWNREVVDGAQFATGMAVALSATWVLFFFTRMAAVRARVAVITLGEVSPNSDAGARRQP